MNKLEYNFNCNFLIRCHLLCKNPIEHNLIGKIGFTIEAPEKRLCKCGLACAGFPTDESNISIRIGGEIYLFIDELSKVLQFY